MLLRIAFVCLLALAASAAQADGRVFSDGWDAGNTSLWSQDGARNRCQAVTSAADGGVGPHTGSYMLRCNWNGTLAWDAAARYETLVQGSYSMNTEILFRFWLRPDNNAKDYTGGGGPKIMRFGTAGSYFSGQFITTPYYNGGTLTGAMYNSVGSQIGATLWGTTPTLSNGQWHKVEIYIRQGTSDGIARLWLDDALQWQATGANTIDTSDWGTFWISSNWSGAAGCCDHDSTNYLYWDDFEVYSDTGTGGTGLMSDGTIAQTGGGGVAPTISSVSCSPTLNQAPAATNCSASASGDTPMTWSWSGAGANCTYATPTAASTTLTCSYGGARTPCVTATNATGSDGPDCVPANSVVWRYVKPTGLEAN